MKKLLLLIVCVLCGICCYAQTVGSSTTCEKCNGHGYVSCSPTMTCPGCNGYGRSIIMGRVYPCGGCHGFGKIKCFTCQGIGKRPCYSCGTTGHRKITYTDLEGTGLRVCGVCNGTGRGAFLGNYCTLCAGLGAVVETNSNSTIGNQRETNVNNHSSYGSSVSRSSCSICHGTGVDPFPWEDAASNAGRNLSWCYTNSSGTQCPYCKKYTWHQHHKCPKCNSSSY